MIEESATAPPKKGDANHQRPSAKGGVDLAKAIDKRTQKGVDLRSKNRQSMLYQKRSNSQAPAGKAAPGSSTPAQPSTKPPAASGATTSTADAAKDSSTSPKLAASGAIKSTPDSNGFRNVDYPQTRQSPVVDTPDLCSHRGCKKPATERCSEGCKKSFCKSHQRAPSVCNSCKPHSSDSDEPAKRRQRVEKESAMLTERDDALLQAQKKARREAAAAKPCPVCTNLTNGDCSFCTMCSKRMHADCMHPGKVGGKDVVCKSCAKAYAAKEGSKRVGDCPCCTASLLAKDVTACSEPGCKVKCHAKCLKEGLCNLCHLMKNPPAKLDVLGPEYLNAGGKTRMMDLRLVLGLLRYVIEQADKRRCDHNLELVLPDRLRDFVSAANAGGYTRTDRRSISVLHCKGNDKVEDHLVAWILLPGGKKSVYVETLDKNHPALEAALSNHDIRHRQADECPDPTCFKVVGPSLKGNGLSCGECIVEIALHALLYASLHPEIKLLRPDDFVSKAKFTAAIERILKPGGHPTPQLEQELKEKGLDDCKVRNNLGLSEPESQESSNVPVQTAPGAPVDPDGDDVPAPISVSSPPTRNDQGRAPQVAVVGPEDRSSTETSDPDSGKDEEIVKGKDGKAKRKKFYRHLNDRFHPVIHEEKEKLTSQGFQPAALRLPGSRMNLEAAKKCTNNEDLQNLLTLDWWVIPEGLDPVMKGISMEQRKAHGYIAKDCLKEIAKSPTKLDQLDEAFIFALNKISKDRGWWSTTHVTKAECLYGALQRLDQYTNLRAKDGSRLTLKLDFQGSFWADARRGWMKAVAGHSPVLGQVTKEAVLDIVSAKKTSLGVATLLQCAWSTTGRPFNWLYVKQRNLKLEYKDGKKENSAPGYEMTVLWDEHKTAAIVGAYVVPTWLPVEWGVRLEKWLSMGAKDHEYVFPIHMWDGLKKDLRKVLKEYTLPDGTRPEWDLKSLRRGSLSTMALAGVPLSTLRIFSGHKSEQTLLRYLRWGLHAEERNRKAIEAAKNLH